MERGERVDGVVVLGERELELDVLSVDPEVPVAVRRARRPRDRTGGARCRRGRDRARARRCSAGTTAVPPAGSAAITSAFASATFSTVPSSSRCSGPMCGMTAMSGRAIALSAAICPSPRMPISVTRIFVSGSSRHTVSGRPISLLRLLSAQIVGACGAQSAPRMSFVEVFPAEPTTATTRAALFERTREASAASAASWSSGTSVAAPRARAAATCSTPVLSATKRSPGPTSRESALIPVIRASRPPPSSLPSPRASISGHSSGITAGPPTCPGSDPGPALTDMSTV